MPDQDDSGEILSFRDKLADYKQLPKHLRNKEQDWANPTLCEHCDMVYSRRDQTVTCGTCGANLNVLECLIYMEAYYQGIEWKLEEIKRYREKMRAMDQAKHAKRQARQGGSA